MVRKCFAPAKVNLGLRVHRKRADGYHDLETVFYRIGWRDTLRVSRASTYTLAVSGMELPVDGANLVTKAAQALARRTGTLPGARVQLEKRVPIGAGLGGGSSDAAAALEILADMWDVSVSEAVMKKIALEVGSDVPFFLGPPVAQATGRGEVLVPMPEYTLPYTLLIVVPDVHVSTAWAFSQIRPLEGRALDLKAIVESNDLEWWSRVVVNDFEALVFAVEPELEQAKKLLLRSGAGYASLSGTGAAVFGVFEERHTAATAAAEAQALGWKTWTESTP